MMTGILQRNGQQDAAMVKLSECGLEIQLLVELID